MPLRGRPQRCGLRYDETLHRLSGKQVLRFQVPKHYYTVVVVWEVTPSKGYPAVDWVLWLENEAEADTRCISDVKSLDVDLKHGDVTEPFVIHGANGGRSEQDDFFPFSLEVPSPEA